ncbi:hypothetical protein R3W88_026670 [Solanum pinnatisectum]|uniref:DUF4283 domain-containing protein n=1 Tax=Solanum pinnatisectum TaxID=50273 RepID=A0AAV9LDX6_9SOLN|nr:hypothetical protein R3W88_026670 [Solanum pinnatisectum]
MYLYCFKKENQVKLSEEDVGIGSEIWSKAIILYVIGNTPPIEVIMLFIATECNLMSKPKVYLHNDGFFVVKLHSIEDKNSILVTGPYMFNNRPIIFKSWTADFDFNKEVLKTIPLWVQFPNLPLHYWALVTLCKICSALGKPLYVNECTLLIEMDVTKPLPKHVEIFYPNRGRMQQKAQYDWEPIYCTMCCIVAHSYTELHKKE